MNIGEIHSEYNFALWDGELTYEKLYQQVLQVIDKVGETFKVNFAVGLMLLETATNFL